MTRKPGDLTCATCAIPMWTGKGTLPQGQARCRSCRQAAWLRDCPRCGTAFSGKGDRRYCTRTCAYAAQAERAEQERADRAAELALTRWANRWVWIEQDGNPDKRKDGPAPITYRPDGTVTVACQTCRYLSEYVDYETGEVVQYVGNDHHDIRLDERFGAVCTRSNPPARYTLLIGPQEWRPGLGRKNGPKIPVLSAPRACAECGVNYTPATSNQLTCSQTCGYERNKRIKREQFAATVRHYECACCAARCVSTSTTARFCSPECNKRAAKRRARGKPERSPILMPRTNGVRARGKGASHLSSF